MISTLASHGAALAFIVTLGLTQASGAAVDERPAASPMGSASNEVPAARERSARVQPAIERGVAWMATVPTAELRFDSAVFLSQVRRVFDLPALDREFARARTVADRDDDHPHRILWVPKQTMPAKVTSGWALPSDPQKRAKPNDVVSEALHCAANGFRAQTLAYACGPMRDDGGYYTTHALWAVALALERNCVTQAETAECVASMHDELLAAQPAELHPSRSLDTDLYAERLLVLLLSGLRGAQIDGFVTELLSVQRPDGSFGVAGAHEPPYHAYHATGVSAWALSQWHARANE